MSIIKVDENLIISNETVAYDNRIIYDFNNRLQNISPFGVEFQVKVFNELVDKIVKSNIPSHIKSESIIITTHVFKHLSSLNTPASILSFGEYFLNVAFSDIMWMFNNKSKFYKITENHENKNENNKINSINVINYNNLDLIADDYFNIVIVNADLIRYNFVDIIDECKRIVDPNGIVILYSLISNDLDNQNLKSINNISFYPLSSDKSVLILNFYNDKDIININDYKNQLLNLINEKNSELNDIIKYIMSVHPQAGNDEWHTAIDHCISISLQIETIVSENSLLFENKVLKYNINEVKNALLDFKYEALLNRKHYDYFQEKLFEIYYKWADNIF